jgi:hypothetical protein
MIFWLVLKLEIRDRVIKSWRILVSFRGMFFGRLYFCTMKYLSFHNSSFCLKILFNVNGKATVWHTPCYIPFVWGNILLTPGRAFFVLFFKARWIGSKGFRFWAPGFWFQASGFEFWGKGFIYLFLSFFQVFILSTLGIKNFWNGGLKLVEALRYSYNLNFL